MVHTADEDRPEDAPLRVLVAEDPDAEEARQQEAEGTVVAVPPPDEPND